MALSGSDESARVTVAGVSKTFDGDSGLVRALDDTEFEVRDGEFVCIVGPSGCGKTTLFRIIGGSTARRTAKCCCRASR